MVRVGVRVRVHLQHMHAPAAQQLADTVVPPEVPGLRSSVRHDHQCTRSATTTPASLLTRVRVGVRVRTAEVAEDVFSVSGL